MCETCNIQTNVNRYDPTHTLTLRNRFATAMRKRFRELRGVIRQSIIEQDCFALQPIQTMQMSPTGRRQFAFETSSQKMAGFMDWLQEQVDRGILEVVNVPGSGNALNERWTDMYVREAYEKGVTRAQQEMQRIGIEISGNDINLAMNNPVHVQRVGILYTRVFEELKGITSAMSQQISRVLADGLARGAGPRELANLLNQTINGAAGNLEIRDSLGRFISARRRAEMLARTEIIRAHHQGMIQEYLNYRVEGVYVQAEWSTAGDNRVCNLCADLQGSIYTLDQIMTMIPRHPQCRCIALPFRQGMDVPNLNPNPN
jgi:SPP1 gp7 family putative phage head morphogenesis protein